ncbi:2-oxo acid dehydrogenase subunit E2 [Leadbetterella sp. DM7]|uniref:2-oxo acid dehydrogenase subunit E2 n=1 Tax=Leadbetterella sp. DM7 TaxID=3235085 RepID=UPI00349EA5C1
MEKFNTPWRLTASTIYRKPTDSKILGSAELDVTDLEKYISELRKKGTKVTLTHFFTLATGRAIAEHIPEFNTYLKRGKIYPFERLTASVSLRMPSGDMSSIKVCDPEKKNYREVVDELTAGIEEAVQGEESKANRMKGALGNIPWPFRKWVYGLIRLIILDLGIAIPALGLSAQSFGTYIISNVGTLGLDGGYPALMPTGNVSLVLILGRVREMPWVHEGQVVPRRVIKISAALDHRVADAAHGGKLFNYLRKAVREPSMFEQ